MNKSITLALQMADEALERNRWVHLNIDEFGNTELIIGPFNSMGKRETQTATYKFYIDATGEPHYITYTHP